MTLESKAKTEVTMRYLRRSSPRTMSTRRDQRAQVKQRPVREPGTRTDEEAEG